MKERKAQRRTVALIAAVRTYLKARPDATNREISEVLHIPIGTVARWAGAVRVKYGIVPNRGRPKGSAKDREVVRHAKAILAAIEGP